MNHKPAIHVLEQFLEKNEGPALRAQELVAARSKAGELVGAEKESEIDLCIRAENAAKWLKATITFLKGLPND